MRKIIDNVQRSVLWLCGGIAVAFLAVILVYVIARGIPYINWEFLSTAYRPGLDQEGIRDIIVGTLAMVGLTLVIAVPIGVLAAIFMAEYAKKGKVLTTIRFCVESLAGIPSILYGLFGYTFFCLQLAFGFSLLSSALTLAIMILPLIMRTAEEALKSVPDSYREASFGLGAGKLRTIFKIVLPSAVPGILSGVILATGRVVGETAALLFTAGTIAKVAGLMDSGRTLAVHMYALSSEGLYMNQMYATGVILMLIVLLINGCSGMIAKKIAKK